MSTWNERRLTCMHGVTEELDYHECDKCRKIAEQMGLEWIPRRQTYIFEKDPTRENKGVKNVI